MCAPAREVWGSTFFRQKMGNKHIYVPHVSQYWPLSLDLCGKCWVHWTLPLEVKSAKGDGQASCTLPVPRLHVVLSVWGKAILFCHPLLPRVEGGGWLLVVTVKHRAIQGFGMPAVLWPESDSTRTGLRLSLCNVKHEP